MRAVQLEQADNPYAVLEAGDILVMRRSFFEEAEEDREFLLDARLSGGQYHKNIAFKPASGKISGVGQMEAAAVERLRSVLAGYSRRVIDFAGNLLPRYRAKWRLEEAGRELPLKKRNDLLHTDAFPTRPTKGGLILRFFTNVHPTKPRRWVTSDPFAVAAPRYAREAGLDGFAGSAMHRFRRAMGYVGLAPAGRSRYDEFMLAFHDYLKRNEEYQRNCPKYRFEFGPGTSWMVFTDIVPHSVQSGQSAVEQTFIVAPESLAAPERAPVAILEKLAGRGLRT
jgi:hypothetical protein